MRTTNLRHHSSVLAAIITLAGCSTDDSDRYEKLDRLRVLAIRSEPPDLSVGETATLSANVYEPAGRELRYEWSWCPSRADAAAAFECNVSEQVLQRAWQAAGLDGAPPTYDLGTDSKARIAHVLSPSLVTALCQAPDLDERVAEACFAGLKASIQLKVQSPEEQLTAIKSVSLSMDETPDAARNTNPTSDFDLTVRDNEGDLVVEHDQPLRAGHRYTVFADVDAGVAETFTPPTRAGEPAPRARRETLVMTWLVTAGEVVAPRGGAEGFDDDHSRTTFVDGSNDVADLLRNGWKLPLTAGPNAELRLVLRDERGGVGWTARSFDVVGGEK